MPVATATTKSRFHLRLSNKGLPEKIDLLLLFAAEGIESEIH